jgi:hypothetical protein
MARTPALFNGPINFTDVASGKEISLPLSSVFFDGSLVKAEGSIYDANKGAADAWLTYLASAGLLKPDKSPPAKPAMKITAQIGGASGNYIQVTFGNFVPDNANAANTTFDAAVTEVDTYTDLKLATIQDALGATAGAGKQPGLVLIPGAAPTDMPAVMPETAMAGDPAKLAVPKNTGAGDAFTLQAKAAGPDGALTKIAIKDVNIAAGTFTLVAKWTKSKAAVKVGDLQTNFAYEITVAPPDGGGGALAPPAPGTVSLSGGSDALARPSVKASANLVTG